MTLNEWQTRFESHFSQLRDERSNSAAHSAVYALEHGMDADQIIGFKRDVNEAVRLNGRPAHGHRLVWAVYAAEMGYEYSGEEYWATFSRQTSKWEDSNVNREYIRTSYRDFQSFYAGAEPRGRWANHFSIICWPITHAILPRDLQRELAHSLFRIRYDFSSALLADPAGLGSVIERDAELVASSRFRQFAEDHLLVGQIASSLLLEESDRSRAHILPATLIRITDDLTKSRRSLEWLRDARQNASRVRTATRPSSASPRQSSSERSPLERSGRGPSDLGLEPRLILRQTAKDVWSAYLCLPNGQTLVRKMPDLRDVLSNQGCQVLGMRGARLARGRFVHKGQDIPLASWPDPNDVLFRFEGVSEDTNLQIAAAGCRLPARRQWLFKILNDRRAEEIATQIVRPGQSYLLLRRENRTSDLPPSATTVGLRCEGVNAYRFAVPEVTPTFYQEMIRRAGIVLSEGLWVRPVGCLTLECDSDSTFEWILPNRPMIQIEADFEVSTIELTIMKFSGEVLSTFTDRTLPLFVDLGLLDSGEFRLEVKAHRHTSTRTISEAYIVRLIERDMDEQAASIAAPFLVDVSPAKPSLEEIWDGKATINIYAPRETTADLRLQFWIGARKAPQSFARKTPLPCAEDTWAEYLNIFKRDKHLRNACDAATKCVIGIDCGSLGHHELNLERQPSPIRWVSKEQNSGCQLRLEELDSQTTVTCFAYPFARPMEVKPLTRDPRTEFRVTSGSLFVAETNQFDRAAVIAAPPIRSLSELKETPNIPALPRQESSIRQLLNVHHLWSTARIVGDASAFDRREGVINGLMNELVRLLCGDAWAKLERTYQGHSTAYGFRHAISTRPDHLALADLIAGNQQTGAEQATETVIDAINRLSVSHHLLSENGNSSYSHALIEFSYRLINRPETLKPHDGQAERVIIESLLTNPVLCRMVRYSYLLNRPTIEEPITQKEVFQ